MTGSRSLGAVSTAAVLQSVIENSSIRDLQLIVESRLWLSVLEYLLSTGDSAERTLSSSLLSKCVSAGLFSQERQEAHLIPLFRRLALIKPSASLDLKDVQSIRKEMLSLIAACNLPDLSQFPPTFLSDWSDPELTVRLNALLLLSERLGQVVVQDWLLSGVFLPLAIHWAYEDVTAPKKEQDLLQLRLSLLAKSIPWPTYKKICGLMMKNIKMSFSDSTRAIVFRGLETKDQERKRLDVWVRILCSFLDGFHFETEGKVLTGMFSALKTIFAGGSSTASAVGTGRKSPYGQNSETVLAVSMVRLIRRFFSANVSDQRMHMNWLFTELCNRLRQREPELRERNRQVILKVLDACGGWSAFPILIQSLQKTLHSGYMVHVRMYMYLSLLRHLKSRSISRDARACMSTQGSSAAPMTDGDHAADEENPDRPDEDDDIDSDRSDYASDSSDDDDDGNDRVVSEPFPGFDAVAPDVLRFVFDLGAQEQRRHLKDLPEAKQDPAVDLLLTLFQIRPDRKFQAPSLATGSSQSGAVSVYQRLVFEMFCDAYRDLPFSSDLERRFKLLLDTVKVVIQKTLKSASAADLVSYFVWSYSLLKPSVDHQVALRKKRALPSHLTEKDDAADAGGSSSEAEDGEEASGANPEKRHRSSSGMTRRSQQEDNYVIPQEPARQGAVAAFELKYASSLIENSVRSSVLDFALNTVDKIIRAHHDKIPEADLEALVPAMIELLPVHPISARCLAHLTELGVKCIVDDPRTVRRLKQVFIKQEFLRPLAALYRHIPNLSIEEKVWSLMKSLFPRENAVFVLLKLFIQQKRAVHESFYWILEKSIEWIANPHSLAAIQEECSKLVYAALMDVPMGNLRFKTHFTELLAAVKSNGPVVLDIIRKLIEFLPDELLPIPAVSAQLSQMTSMLNDESSSLVTGVSTGGARGESPLEQKLRLSMLTLFKRAEPKLTPVLLKMCEKDKTRPTALRCLSMIAELLSAEHLTVLLPPCFDLSPAFDMAALGQVWPPPENATASSWSLPEDLKLGDEMQSSSSSADRLSPLNVLRLKMLAELFAHADKQGKKLLSPQAMPAVFQFLMLVSGGVRFSSLLVADRPPTNGSTAHVNQQSASDSDNDDGSEDDDLNVEDRDPTSQWSDVWLWAAPKKGDVGEDTRRSELDGWALLMRVWGLTFAQMQQMPKPSVKRAALEALGLSTPHRAVTMMKIWWFCISETTADQTLRNIVALLSLVVASQEPVSDAATGSFGKGKKQKLVDSTPSVSPVLQVCTWLMSWLCRRIRKPGTRAWERLSAVKLCAAVLSILAQTGVSVPDDLIISVLVPIILFGRHMSSHETSQECQHLCRESETLMQDLFGAEQFARTFSAALQRIDDRRMQRRRQRKELQVADPEHAEAVRAGHNRRKQEAKKAKKAKSRQESHLE
jgi:hypothetical protein